MASVIEPLAPSGVFSPTGRYFNTPTYGLAPATTREVMIAAVDRWSAGEATMADYDGAVAESRRLFAGLVGSDPEMVAIGANVSSLVGPVAASLEPGSTVLVPDGEFTSLLFPLLVNQGVSVRHTPLDDLAAGVGPEVDVVAFSLVQSSNGVVAPLPSILDACRTHGVRTLVDATHAAGWLPFHPGDFDFVFVAAYKWLLCPRGVAFMVAGNLETPPVNAGWYSGENPWTSIYGGPLRLADSARRFDTSPAWLSWVGAVPSLQLMSDLGVAAIHDHDVSLANRLRAGLGMEPGDSAIVTFQGDPERLAGAGFKVAGRAGSVRVGCHIHNSSDDVDALVSHLRDGPA